MVLGFYRLSVTIRLALVSSLVTFSSSVSAVEPIGVLHDFESAQVPPAWTSQKGSSLELSRDRYKSGQQSLRWLWNKRRATLEYHSESDFKQIKAKTSAISIWIYNEKPIDDKLVFKLLGERRITKRFFFGLNFKGWRCLRAPWAQLGWKSGTSITGMRLYAPSKTVEGQLYIDFSCWHVQDDLHWLVPDVQMPWVNADAEVSHWLDFYRPYQLPWPIELASEESITTEQYRDMNYLTKRFLTDIAEPQHRQGITDQQLKESQEHFSSYRIQREDDSITGRPVGLGTSALKPQEMIRLDEYLTTMLRVGRLYRKANRPEVVEELRQMYFDLCDHLVDQGWAEGSAAEGGFHHFGYGTRHWTDALEVMRDELEQSGRLRAMTAAVEWYNAGNDLKKIDPRGDMDLYRTQMMHMFKVQLLYPNGPEKLRRLKCFQRWLSLSILSGVIGPNGELYHHGMHHPAYGYSPTANLLVELIYEFSKTEFRISEAAHQRLKTAMINNHFATNHWTTPPNLVGRAGGVLSFDKGMKRLGRLALAGSPDRTQEIDHDLAGLYLAYANKSEGKLAKQFREAGVEPRRLTGHLSLNGTSAAIHRRNDWLVSVDGMNQFHRGIEIYGWLRNNCYSRWACNGSVSVLSKGAPITPHTNGYQQEGWDWNRWPGATSLVVPSYKLFRHYGAYTNASPFAGGASLDGNGVWGMNYTDGELTFKKSAFFFGNSVTLVTTDVESDSQYSVLTGLYQSALDKVNHTTLLNGKEQQGLHKPLRLSGQKPHYLMDNFNNGYYVHPGGDDILVARQQQQWTYMYERHLRDPSNNPLAIDGTKIQIRNGDIQAAEKLYTPTEGEFASAWLDHGKRPERGTSVYTLLVDTTDEELMRFAQRMEQTEIAPIKVLRSDSKAHIALDRGSSTCGYVLFHPAGLSGISGPLKSVNRPCVAAIGYANKTLSISVYSSDKRNTEDFKLRLNGNWELYGSYSSTDIKLVGDNDFTTLRLAFRDYLPTTVRLKRSRK